MPERHYHIYTQNMFPAETNTRTVEPMVYRGVFAFTGIASDSHTTASILKKRVKPDMTE